jgi:hypothetical protein
VGIAAGALGFSDRVGRALVAPRAALAAADRGEGGASDALVLLGLKVLCTELRFLVAAAWALVVVGPAAAGGALVTRLSSVLGVDLIVIFGGALLVTLAAGRRRAVGRDFDLACTAWIPLLVVDTAGMVVLPVLPLETMQTLATLAFVGALAWTGGLLLLAVGTARRRTPAGDAGAA